MPPAVKLSSTSAVQAAVGCSDSSTLRCARPAGLASQRRPGRLRGLVRGVEPVHGSTSTVRAPAPHTVPLRHVMPAGRRVWHMWLQMLPPEACYSCLSA